MSPPSLHKCGACGARLFTARMRDTGRLVHIEKVASVDVDGASLVVVPDIPGLADGALPHVALTIMRRTHYRQHDCPSLRSFSGRTPANKVRP